MTHPGPKREKANIFGHLCKNNITPAKMIPEQIQTVKFSLQKIQQNYVTEIDKVILKNGQKTINKKM